MKKLIVNCDTQEIEELEMTEEEQEQRLAEQQQAEQQSILNNLKPTQEEITKAEREIETINLLTELGVIV